jgi:hypothetical protein
MTNFSETRCFSEILSNCWAFLQNDIYEIVRYVKKVPLAAELLDVRRSQKLEMVKELKVERARFRFEEEIRKAPPLSEEEVWLEIRQRA